MRALTAAETALLALGKGRRTSHARVYVQHSGGTYNDLTSYLGKNWIRGITIRESSDQRIATCTVRLQRDVHQLSLSPLNEGSKANQLSGSFVAAIDEARLVYVEAALAPIDGPAIAYKKVFHGYIDSWDMDSDSPEIVLECRDLAGMRLQDRMIEAERYYSDSTGIALAVLIAGASPGYAGTDAGSILGDNRGSGYGPDLVTIALKLVGTPNWAVRKIEGGFLNPLTKQPVFDALKYLADMIGWECRYKYDDSDDTYKLTLYAFDRTDTAVDATINTSDVDQGFSVNRDLSDVRNIVEAVWLSSGVETTDAPTDATSITKYGRRYMYIPRQATDNIDTQAEIDRFTDAVLSDLKTARVGIGFEVPYRKDIELGDIVRVPGDGVLWKTTDNYDFGVFALEHSWGEGGEHGRTRVTGLGGKSSDSNTPKVTPAEERWLIIDAGRTGVIRPVSFEVPKACNVSASRITSGQAVTQNNNTTVICNSAVYNMGSPGSGPYNTATGVFTAPFAGVFHFNCGVTMGAMDAGKSVDCSLYVNSVRHTPGTFASNNIFNDSTTGDITVTAVAGIELADGDTVTLSVNHNSDGSKNTVIGATKTWFKAYALVKGRAR